MWVVGPLAGGEKTGSDDLRKKLDGLSPGEQVEFLASLRTRGPRDARVSFYLGNAHLGLDRPDSAVVYYEEAVAVDSTYAKAHVNLGIALERLNRFDDARSHYEKAIEIDSTDVLARCHLGHYYHVRGEIGEAVDHYRRALEIDPQSAQAHYNLGLAFADSRLFAEAAREWETVIQLSPESELGRTATENVRLIRTYMKAGAPEDGKQEPAGRPR
jgi:tetratricopeptide (TPR) repeat protein